MLKESKHLKIRDAQCAKYGCYGVSSLLS